MLTSTKSSKQSGKQQKSNLLSQLKSSPSTTSNQKKLRFQLAKVKQLYKERKASTTLGIIMSAFTFCWLPFFVLALMRPFLENTHALKTLATLFLWLGYANSLLNPIIYATLNRDFRKPFQAILYCRCGSLNHMMREEFYHSQYGEPDPHAHQLQVPHHLQRHYDCDYDEGVEYIEADGERPHHPTAGPGSQQEDKALESFL
nr:unnamed protein product [Callosobruchus analis]